MAGRFISAIPRSCGAVPQQLVGKRRTLKIGRWVEGEGGGGRGRGRGRGRGENKNMRPVIQCLKFPIILNSISKPVAHEYQGHPVTARSDQLQQADWPFLLVFRFLCQKKKIGSSGS